MFKIGPLGVAADMDWTAEQIDDIVSRSEYQHEGSVEDGNLTMAQIDDPHNLKEKTRAREQMAKAKAAGKKTASDKAGVPPEKIVKALVLALNAESLEMAFPYLLLHCMAWRLLQAVKDSCHAVLAKIHTQSYMEKENELPWVVGYIFLAAGRPGQVKPDYRPMESAVVAFEDFISSGANIMAISIAEEVGFPIGFEIEQEETEGGAY